MDLMNLMMKKTTAWTLSTSTMPPMKLAVSKPGGWNSGLPVNGALVVVVPNGTRKRRGE